MSWRTIVIENKAKLSYKGDYLLVRNEEVKMIHLSEINTIIIDSTMTNITSYLICEIIKWKIKLVFCDEKRNPIGEIVPYYGSHNTSKRVITQTNWSITTKQVVWTAIINEKIRNQAGLLRKLDLKNDSKLYTLASQLTINDTTNREGHAAKVYFNTLFGKNFNRKEDNSINAALNYGYSILLSNFNKEIVSMGYLTQLGLKHKNEFNQFNLTSDLMEPFRILVDEIVYKNRDNDFTGGYKVKLVDILNKKVMINNSMQFITNAISIYLNSIFQSLNKDDPSLLHFLIYP